MQIDEKHKRQIKLLKKQGKTYKLEVMKRKRRNIMKKHKTIGKVLSLLLALSLLFQPITGLAKKEEKTTKKSDIVIDVLEFGADPTGINDSAEAIWNALEEAKKV